MSFEERKIISSTDLTNKVTYFFTIPSQDKNHVSWDAIHISWDTILISRDETLVLPKVLKPVSMVAWSSSKILIAYCKT